MNALVLTAQRLNRKALLNVKYISAKSPTLKERRHGTRKDYVRVKHNCYPEKSQNLSHRLHKNEWTRGFETKGCICQK